METLKKDFVVFKERRKKAPFLAPSKGRKESISPCHQALVVTTCNKCHTIMYLKHVSYTMNISMYPRQNRLTIQYFLAQFLCCDITFKAIQFIFYYTQEHRSPVEGAGIRSLPSRLFSRLLGINTTSGLSLHAHTHIASLFV